MRLICIVVDVIHTFMNDEGNTDIVYCTQSTSVKKIMHILNKIANTIIIFMKHKHAVNSHLLNKKNPNKYLSIISVCSLYK